MMRADWFMSCLLTGCSILFSAGCNRSPQKTDPVQTEQITEKTEVASLPARPDQHFAGSSSCKACHKEIAELFASHPMGQSAARISSGPTVENYEAAYFLARNRFAYTAIKKEAGQVIHREEKLYLPIHTTSNKDSSPSAGKNPIAPALQQQTEKKKPIYQLDHAVDYYIGSAQRGRCYVLRKNGLLFQSPITWYSKSKKWNMSPGYMMKNSHFERRIDDRCVMCHVGRIASDPQGYANRFAVSDQQIVENKTLPSDSAVKESETQSPLMIEAAISCERCHGPSADHVSYQQKSHEKDSAEEDPILLIAHMDSRQRESLCNQCHLVEVDRVLRYGRSEYDFRPGDDLSDIWVTFVNNSDLHGNSPETVNHVEQMHDSVCYQKSAGKMDCTSCHDPHSVPEQQQRITFYRDRCLTCHSDKQPECSMPEESRKLKRPEDSCIACHMPTLKGGDIPHTSQTDHRVLRDPQKQLPVSAQNQNSKLVLFDQAEKRIPESAVNRAKALLMAVYAEQDNDVYLARAAINKLVPLHKIFPDDAQLLVKSGIMERLFGSKTKAKEYLKKALQINSQQEDALLQLGLLCHELSEYKEGLTYLQSYLEINPWNRDATGRQVHMLGLTNQFQTGIQKAEQALLKFPDDWRIHGWLVDAYKKVGRLEEAKKHAEIYEQVKPDSPK